MYPIYKLNLIVPKKLKNSDFSKFDPDLGFLLKVLKLGEKGVSKMISEPQYQSVDGETALLANEIGKLGLEIGIDEGGKTDMCKAMEENNKKKKVEGGIEVLRGVLGNDDIKIVQIVSQQLKVTPEYVRSIMNGPTTDAATVRA